MLDAKGIRKTGEGNHPHLVINLNIFKALLVHQIQRAFL